MAERAARKTAAKVAAKGRTTKAKPNPRASSKPPAKTAAKRPARKAAEPRRVDPAEGLPPHKYVDDGAGACERECGKGPRAAIHKPPARETHERSEVDAPPVVEPGPLERAYVTELGKLRLDETALGASAIALARMADKAADASSSSSAVELLREARMALSAARGLGRAPELEPTGTGKGGEVVSETRVERLRRERAERAASHGR